MTVSDKLLLGIDTSLSGMGIVFIVLILLWGGIVAQSKLIRFFTEVYKKPVSSDFTVNMNKADSSIIDDETRAIIMAVVSQYEGIPLSRLEFKSIKVL